MTSVVISGSGLFVPPYKVSNQELVDVLNAFSEKFNSENAVEIAAGTVEAKKTSSVEFIEKASGIKSRYMMCKDGVTDINVMHPKLVKNDVDTPPEMVLMAVEAAKEALKDANKNAEDIDLVILGSSNMQRSYPSMAVEVQSILGAQGFGFDMNVACSTATFALINAVNAIKSGSAKTVLIVNPEFTTPQLDYSNRDSHFIFGDVATALIIESTETATSDNQFKIINTSQVTKFSNNIRCNHSYVDHCYESLPADNSFFFQEGRKVFKELLPMVTTVITEHLGKNNWPVTDVKRMWLHQANINMNLFAAKKLLGREPEFLDAPLILDEFANTASAGSIVAFHKYKDDFTSGDKGILCSFGAGYSVGCISLEKI
ncbi:beta-ketoacyl-ACP synthase III [Psychrosphaera sp. B3R10]|uniref:beta-ketoacyl-ACP synthase III n=1 Tax=unclassified Psychrosphaera TaxID=2641570 RepID=UPI001C090CA9|nr:MULTISPECIES: beta-ketoacyl-ACP synthase III [unclassified Psychrosphaera]MBU2882799.1 beta-ketoacyl-ACP synthase III [Psychrosphaera sp. I2R16]MBU2988051.1 beta-ketoacyl-ACP synthase III [Psychrosphaera sp. B3R10]MDO6721071.1 beta-ketoacyl-ACP synthase III [Psychrosphaera sp. 1_MG-2023]